MRLLALLLFFLCAPALAQESSVRPYVLPHSQVVPFKSDINGVDYELYVSVPKDYQHTDKPYPLLLTLDADYQFAIATNQIARLASHNAQAPEMIVVSIGYAYDPDDMRAYRLNRTRDYTPAHTEKGGYGPEFQKVSGGGPAFADVIEKEILPLVGSLYRIDAQARVFVGHSYGGLFGAWLLLNRPQLFSRYILVSPSLWYNDHMMLAAAGAGDPLERKTKVYLGVGAWENQAPPSYAMADDLRAFAAALEARNDPNLDIDLRVFEDETHASIYPAALSTGLRRLFAND
ncbi:MAG: alpha/beta hydrolase [Oricola sp.]|jgi:uncharacterized protein|nr:alpha/beta hydrolase [Oricola sp.]